MSKKSETKEDTHSDKPRRQTVRPYEDALNKRGMRGDAKEEIRRHQREIEIK